MHIFKSGAFMLDKIQFLKGKGVALRNTFLTLLLCFMFTSNAWCGLSGKLYSNSSLGPDGITMIGATDTSYGLTAINAVVGTLNWTVDHVATGPDTGKWQYTYFYVPTTSNKNRGIGDITLQFGLQPGDIWPSSGWTYTYYSTNATYVALMSNATTDGALQTIDRTINATVYTKDAGYVACDSWLDAANPSTSKANVTTTFQGLQWLINKDNPNGSNNITFQVTTALAPMWGNIYMDGFNKTTNNGYSFLRNTNYDSAALPFSMTGSTVAGKLPVPGVPDTVPPTVTVSAPSVSITKNGPVTYTVTYTDDNFNSSSLSSGSISINPTGNATGTVDVTGSGNTRTVNISNITGDGTLGISIASGTAKDASGNLAPASDPSATFAVDNTPPSVTIGFPSPAAAKSGPVTYTVTYEDPHFDVSTLSTGNITLNKNGADGTVSLSGTGSLRYVTIDNITGTGTMGISIAAGTAVDTVGNLAPAAGPSTPVTIDTDAPTAALSYSPAGPYKAGTAVTITAAFSEAMAVSPAPKLTLSGADSLAGADMARTDATHYTYSYTAGSGSGSVNISLSTGTDLVGNVVASTPTGGASFTLDNTAPTAAISYSTPGPYKAGTAVTITAAFSKAMAVSPAPKLTLTGADSVSGADMARSDATHYTYSYTAGSGSGGVNISLSTGTDLVGNVVTSTPTGGASFTLDNTVPTAAISYSTPGPYKAGTAVTITATFSESMAVSPVPKLTLSGADSLSVDMTRSDATHYTYSYTAGSGSGSVNEALSTGTDLVGNVVASAPTGGASFTLDNTAPTVGSTSPVSGATGIAIDSAITATFSEDINAATLTTGSFTVSGGVTGTISYDPSTRTARFTPALPLANSTTYTASITTDVKDLVGNAMTVPATWTFTTTSAPDTTHPTAALSYSPSGPYKAGTALTITAAFSEAMAVSPAPKLTLTGADSVSGADMTRVDATHYTYIYMAGSGSGDVSAALSTGTDLAGNVVTSAPTGGASFTLDNTAPTAAISYSTPGPYKAETAVTITATFSKAMAVSPAPKLTLTGADSVSGADMTRSDATHYTYSYTAGSGSGDVSAALSTGTDLAGNVVVSTPTGGASFTLDNAAPTAAISYSTPGPYKTGTVVTITAAFSKAMAVSPAPKLTLSGADSLSGADMARSDATHYTYSYTAGSGSGGVNVSLSTGTDLVGNLVASTPTSGASFTLDNTVPTAVISYSTPGPYKAGTAVTITATFSESMAVSPAPKLTLTGADSLSGVDMTRSDATHYTYSYTAGSGSGSVNVALSAGTDLVGNVVASAPTGGAGFSLDNTAPTVSSTAPVSNATGVAIDSAITATFSEDINVATLTTGSFTVSGGVTGSISYDPSTRTARFTPVSPLAYSTTYTATITTNVKDLVGNAMAAPATWSFTTTAVTDTTQPTAAISYSTPGPYKAGTAVTITATFSEAMAASPLPKIALSGAASLAATDMTRVDATHYTYSYTVSSGNGVVNVALSAGTDLVGNPVVSVPTSGAGFTLDCTPPSVLSTIPTSGSTSMAVNGSITATFSEAIDPATINASTLSINGITGSVSYNAASHIATFTPSAALAYSTLYTATITSAVADKAGNFMSADATWTFTTVAAPDTTPPTVLTTVPVNGAAYVAVNEPINVVFSEAINPTTISNATFTVSGVSGQVNYDSTTNTATFTPNAPFAYNTSYTATVSTGVKDLTGNAMAADKSWTFTTAPHYGDADNSGGPPDINDARIALQIVAGLITPTSQQLAACDVAPLVGGKPNPNGKVDLGDVMAILRRVAGLTDW